MPELPEVENLRRGLEKKILGQKIKKVIVSHEKLVSGSGNLRKASPAKTREFINELTGETISGVERRAKNLIFNFKPGSETLGGATPRISGKLPKVLLPGKSGKVLLAHLKMSGQFVYYENMKRHESTKNGHSVIPSHPGHSDPPVGGEESTLRRAQGINLGLPNKHTHIVFELSRGTLFYNDIRTFGYLLYFPNREALIKSKAFHGLGVEPLSKDFTYKYFASALKPILRGRIRLRRKTSNLKTLFLNQSVVVGLGNIYADEVCFAAGVRPSRRAASLKAEEIKKIYGAIKKIIPRAIKTGGSSVATYMLLDESRGNFAREHKVYGRSGEKCLRCGRPLFTAKIAGRTTVFCKNCQG